MTRREMTLQGALVLALVCGIVGGNFLLHRWVIGSATSREASAGTPLHDDLDEFAPSRRATSQTAASNDPAAHRELLQKLIAEKLPQASTAERETWLEELSEVSLKTAEGVLDLRHQVGAFPEIDETPTPRILPVETPTFNFSIGISR